MQRKYLISLYIRFKHFENPEIIRQKIKEEIDKQTLIKHRNIIKTHKEDIQNFENLIFEISERINTIKNISNELNSKDFTYHFENVVYNTNLNLQELIEKRRKIDIRYNYSKYWLKEYLKGKEQ